jgi:uncharacterized protein (TIGR04206 family)
VTPRRRLVAVLALLCVPWSVLTFAAGDVTLLFAWGLVDPGSAGVTSLYHFLFVHTAGLPAFILAWPLSVALYLLAVGSASGAAVVGREDPRVTGGLLVLAGVTQVSLARGFSVQPGRSAWPVGALALAAVAWWVYWPRVRDR